MWRGITGWMTMGRRLARRGWRRRWTSSKKDAVSTAYSASSRVWFTMSHGTLNEIYYPTIDRPQTRDMELLFTDGETFFHEEKRDINYDFHYVDDDAPAVKVVGSDPEGRYTVTKEMVADPHHSVVLMNVKIAGDEAVLSRMKCYALLAPHLHGGGAGNSARSCWWRASGCCWRGMGRCRWRWGRTAGLRGRRAGMWGRATATRT